MTGVTAGAVGPVHEVTLERCAAQQAVGVRGQADIVTAGLPYVGPYNVNSILNPVPRHVHGARVLLQPLPGRPARARGRRDDLHAPGHARVPPGPPPLLRRLLRGGAGRDDRPGRDRAALREAPTPRTSGTATCTGRRYAYHGVHPFYMWYWGAHALRAPRRRDLRRRRPGGVPPDGLPPRRHDARRAGDGRAGRRAATRR